MLLRIILLLIVAVVLVVGVIAYFRAVGRGREANEQRARADHAEQRIRTARATLSSVERDLRVIANGETGNPALSAQTALDAISTFHHSDNSREIL